MNINVKPYCEVGKHVFYYLSQVSISSEDTLVDRGDDGGIASNDVRVIAAHIEKTVNIPSIDNHEIIATPFINACAVASNVTSEVIVIMNQYSYQGKNKTVHSSPQTKHCENKVDDRSIKVGSGQHVTSLHN